MNQDRTKILIHLPFPLKPINNGAKRRIVGILNYFKERNDFFSVDVVASNEFRSKLWDSEQKQEVLKFAERIFVYEGEHNLVDFLYSRSQSFYYQKILREQLPVDSRYCTPPGYIEFVKTLVSTEKYNFILINYLEYANLVIDSKSSVAKTLIDMHDLCCEARIARKNISHLKGLKFDYESNLNREINLLNKFDTVLANSHHEMALISSHLSSQKIHLIPHLVEDSNHSLSLGPYSSREFKYDLVFVGARYQPNIDGLNFFLTSIFPEIIEEKPDTKLAIAGTVTQCVQIDASLEQNVDCLGYVPDLSDLYLKSRLVICPLLDGSGTKVKLQEAMAYAIPTVTTTTGASGLNLIDGVNALITDEPTVYAYQILRLLKEPELAQKLSEEVAMTFKNHYSNSAVYSKLDQLLGISPS
ncbi:glycosyltransferase family 4 protein [Microcoleus sp. K1-B6]|uniref:glycosyltransferase family 4 protein n=1 Tax=unclassified Microcoleus TaxID=2642155 RepID=UPI002FD57EC3